MAQSLWWTVTLLASLTQLSLAKECGVRAPMAEKIFSGELARENEFPWQISMRFQGGHRCGGSIISDRWILTAAHCVFIDDRHVPPESLSILIGSLDNSIEPSETDGSSSRVLPVKRSVSHPLYKHIQHDIALIELAEPIGLNQTGDNINSICLGRPQDVTAGREVIVSGWGWSGLPEPPIMLRKANNTVMDFNKCQSFYPRLQLNQGHVCSSGKGAACYGDSGGPLQYQVEGRWHLMGLVSFGTGICDDPSEPVVFARVAHYLDFIKKVTGL